MKDKKIVAILGSPHKNGKTGTMLDYAIQSAERVGYEVIKINLYEKKIGYCKGCRTCHDTKICVIQDDMADISKQIKECDIIMLAAPVYWANVPAVVKNLFDRLVGCAMEETKTFPKPRLKGKKYMLLTACNTPSPFAWIFGQSRGAIKNMDEFFKTAGMKCIGKFVCTSASKISKIPDSLRKRIEKSFK